MPFSFSTGSLSSMKRQILVAWTPEHKESWQKDTWEKPLSTNKCHECFGSDFSEKSFPEQTSSLTATALSDRIIAQVKMCRKRVYRRHGGHQEGGEGAALSTSPAPPGFLPCSHTSGLNLEQWTSRTHFWKQVIRNLGAGQSRAQIQMIFWNIQILMWLRPL